LFVSGTTTTTTTTTTTSTGTTTTPAVREYYDKFTETKPCTQSHIDSVVKNGMVVERQIRGKVTGFTSSSSEIRRRVFDSKSASWFAYAEVVVETKVTPFLDTHYTIMISHRQKC